MNNPTMLYRCPGAQSFEGVSCETTIVDELDVPSALADGWHRNWVEAGRTVVARLAENEQQQEAVAQKLDKPAICAALDAADIQYDKRWSVEKLTALLPS